MKKFTMKTKLGEALTDNRAVEIIKRNLPFVMNHPRFTEALEYSLEEIINDDMGQIIGIAKKRIKKIMEEIVELEVE